MKVILQNSSFSDQYSEQSFMGLLHEHNVWDDEEYFNLENYLYELCDENKERKKISRDMAWPIVRIYSYIMLALASHNDVNDGFEILNITNEQFYKRRERQLLIFEGFFKGEMPDKEMLEY